jgi:iron complex outermembrane receptor protein
MSDYSLNQSGPVATYYDEVYKGNFAFLGVALYDLERVEVLRGPQGTLYGKNTTGGAVNLISRKPEIGKTEGNINLGYGNYNRREANGAINLPLGDTAAARIAFTVARADGWFRNQLPGKPDLGGTREYAVRGSLLWKPQDGMSFLLRASTSYQNPYNYGIYAAPGPDGVGAGLYESLGQGTSYFRTGIGRRDIESNYTPRRKARTYAVSLTSTFDIASSTSARTPTAPPTRRWKSSTATAPPRFRRTCGWRAVSAAPSSSSWAAITTARRCSTPPTSASSRMPISTAMA